MDGRASSEENVSVDTVGAFINRDFSASGEQKESACKYGAILPLQSMAMRNEGDESGVEATEGGAPTDRFTVPDVVDPDDLPCGWGPFRPAFCQKFRDPKVVLILLCCVSAIQVIKV